MEAYANATGNDLNLILGWMKAETWLSAEEARELNFCDVIEDAETASSPVAAFDFTKFKSAPPELVRLAIKSGWAAASPHMENDDV